MNRSIKPYLQLVRLPNLFTAAADSLAGWLIARGTLSEPGRWLPLVLASVAIYAAGIVLNDVFDFEIDLRERPNRPLPSGRVSRRFAAWFGGIALVLGPVLASLSGSINSVIVSLVLAACVLAYDAGLKRTVLGPEAMGACRGLNLLLGLSQAEAMGGHGAWLAAGSLALFVVGVTWISRSEVETGKTRGILAGLVLEDLAILGLLAAGYWIAREIFPSEARGPIGLEGIVVLGILTPVVNRAVIRALRKPEPALIQRAVKTGVLSLVWLDVALVACVRGPWPALAVAALWVPAFVLGKWLYST
jgi:4-hydroxybenzoate polyprenyltransferase